MQPKVAKKTSRIGRGNQTKNINLSLEVKTMTIEFANRLAELRKNKGLSQEELADKLGVSRQAVSKWERGEASPDTDNLIELARIYDISLDELVGLSNNDKKKNNRIMIRSFM